jgi:hypothetical protein
MRKGLLAISLVLLISVIGLVPACNAQPTYPQDLQIEAFAGGVAPWTPLYRVQISPDGSAVYSQVAPDNRGTATWTQSSTFDLTAGEMQGIWNAIDANNFFSLGQSYSTPAWDGSFAVMTITANGVTYKVVTENTAVQPFDSIVMAINDVTLGDQDLFYNAIASQIGAFSDSMMPLQASSGTSGKIDGCNITVTIRIELCGTGANATAVEQDIENYWNQGNPHVQCVVGCPIRTPGCSVRFDAVVRVRAASDPPTPGYYQIKVFAPGTGSYPFSFVWVNNMTGEWCSVENPKAYAHETGHLMGEGDAYNRTAGADGTMFTADDIVTALAGHENDLMASILRCTEAPSQDSIDRIVARLGIICPCECCEPP